MNVDITGTVKGNIEVSEGLKGNLKVSGGEFEGADIAALASVEDGFALKRIDGVYTVTSEQNIADINGSGAVDAEDISYIASKLLDKISDSNLYDIDGSGAFDIIDLIRIKKLAAA